MVKIWMDGWMDGWIDGRTDGRTDGWMERRRRRTTMVMVIVLIFAITRVLLLIHAVALMTLIVKRSLGPCGNGDSNDVDEAFLR